MDTEQKLILMKIKTEILINLTDLLKEHKKLNQDNDSEIKNTLESKIRNLLDNF